MSHSPRTLVSLEPGTRFDMPRIPTRLPLLAHPEHARIEKECSRWARPYLVEYFDGAELADRYLRQRMTYWACLCYPHMLDDRRFTLPNIMIPAGICDDSFSRPGVQESLEQAEALRQLWLAMFDGGPVAPEFPAGRMLRDALAPAWPQMFPDLAGRYRDAYRDIVASAVTEADARLDDDLLPFDDYMELRLTNLFGYWSTCQTEYALGCDLTGELATDPALAKARDLAINHMTLVNDLYSFPKEYEAGEAMNCMWILLRGESLSLQQAVDRVGELIGLTEESFSRTCAEITSGGRPLHPAVPTYLTELGHLISGNLHYHGLTTRYHGDATFGTSGQRAGTVTIQRLGTVHSPARVNV
ncbi:terpene synthase family protein [Streptomyces sp. NPDC003035]|uniref:terpene synthase family protein n=1 Tax=Streptomyces sp. NPDC003035 TaxID=3364676 RepID=UPI0036B2B060